MATIPMLVTSFISYAFNGNLLFLQLQKQTMTAETYLELRVFCSVEAIQCTAVFLNQCTAHSLMTQLLKPDNESFSQFSMPWK